MNQDQVTIVSDSIESCIFLCTIKLTREPLTGSDYNSVFLKLHNYVFFQIFSHIKEFTDF